MNLIAIVLALVLERILSYSPAWRAHDLTARWMNWVNGILGVRSWSLVFYLLLPVAAVALLDQVLASQPLGPLLQLPLALLVLISCIGPRDLNEEFDDYRKHLEAGDREAAERLIDDLLTGPHRDTSSERGIRSPVAGCFVQGHERWFAVLFWFFLLGPAGAVAYRVLGSVAFHLRHEGYGEDSLMLTEWLHGAMAWPSARVAALCFALAGSADEAFTHWRGWMAAHGGNWVRDSWSLLATIGVAAMQHDPSEPHSEPDLLDTALRLLGRSIKLFLAFLALLTIGGWMA